MSSAKPSLMPRTHARSQNRYPAVSLTRQGIMLLVVSAILLLTAVNYSNHNILLIALFLLSLFTVSLLLVVRYFQRMDISLGEVTSVFLGQEIHLPLGIHLKHKGDEIPVVIKTQLDSGDTVIHEANLTDIESNSARFSLIPRKRGRYTIVNVLISTSFPFGLFRVQQSLATKRPFWVYPKPLVNGSKETGTSNHHNSDTDDSIILRQYRLGDPVRRIHKKSLAMGQQVLVKDVEGLAHNLQWLRWEQLQDMTDEKRLQVLTQQVMDADRQGRSYGLSLPTGKVNPASGEAHKHHCLRMLAEY